MSIDKKAFGLSDSLVSAVNEALKGGQKKLDKNHNGKLDSDDFKKLRGEGASDLNQMSGKKKPYSTGGQSPGGVDEAAKPDYLDFDKDGNKKEPMKKALKQVKEVADGNKTNFKANMKEGPEEKDATNPKQGSSVNPKQRELDELSPATLSSYKAKAAGSEKSMTDKSSSLSVPAKDRNVAAVKANQRRIGMKLATKKLGEETVEEAATKMVAKPQYDKARPAFGGSNVAADMDARKTEVQRKIAQKQASMQMAKANKRISGQVKEDDKSGKCSCGSTNESKMKCEVHGGKKGLKGGKEPIEMNPPLREASDLPKKVVKKGHEIAKSLIRHRSNVKEPYAVGMATAKKSAGIKEDAEQVDELSNKTLQSYKSKSENEIGDAAKKIRGKAKNTVDAKKVYNRIKGIQLASKKLNKKD